MTIAPNPYAEATKYRTAAAALAQAARGMADAIAHLGTTADAADGDDGVPTATGDLIVELGETLGKLETDLFYVRKMATAYYTAGARARS